MVVTVSDLKNNIYQLFDRILETGEPLEVKRKGAFLKITPIGKKGKIDRLKHRPVMCDEPDSYVHFDSLDE